MCMLVNLYLNDSIIHNYIDVVSITTYNRKSEMGALLKKDPGKIFFFIFYSTANTIFGIDRQYS